jgi:hypothetical protein
MANGRLKIAPGIVRVDSPYAQPGRYINSQWVRFYRLLPQKIGGWKKWIDGKLSGIPRSITAWRDLSKNNHVAVGTHSKLYAIAGSSKAVSNITPIRSTGTFGSNPFSLTNGSDIITAALTAHGCVLGDTIKVLTSVVVGNQTIFGEYEVIAVPTSGTIQFRGAVVSTSTTTGGGAGVGYSTEINVGLKDPGLTTGHGVGGYGLGAYGTPRSSVVKKFLRVWTLDQYGQNLLAMPTDGPLYMWVPGDPRALLVANSPTALTFFVSSDRHVVVLGADGDAMKIRWAHQTDITNWTPGPTSTAGERRLQFGSYLVAGATFGNNVNLIWSDTEMYLMQYTGSKFIFDTRETTEFTGLIGPNAFVIAGGVAYWMSQHGFKMFSGGHARIPRADDIQEYVYRDFNREMAHKVVCYFNDNFSEVWWLYPSENSAENNRYVAVNTETWDWICGIAGRTAVAHLVERDQKPIMASQYGRIFEHESGLNGDGLGIISFIETGMIDIDDGSASLEIDGFIPDFQRHKGEIFVEITGYDYPAQKTPMEKAEFYMTDATSLVDLRMNIRQASIKISSQQYDGDFRIGDPRFQVKARQTKR